MTALRARAVKHGLWVGGVLCFCYVFLIRGPSLNGPGFDAYSYWAVELSDPYRGEIGSLGWFPYSPAAAQLSSVFALLPWSVFVWLWVALLLAALAWVGRSWAVPLLAFPPVVIELFSGNVNLLIAAAIVAGFRYPWAWAFVLLTKLSPGIGLVWFAVRREWRSLAVAVATTAAIAGLSFVVAPHLWLEWFGMLATNAARDPRLGYHLPVPLTFRLPVALALVVWGARNDRSWTVPVAATLSMPVLWPGALAVLVAVVPLLRRPQMGHDEPEKGQLRAVPA
jgi:hypothetical protein